METQFSFNVNNKDNAIKLKFNLIKSLSKFNVRIIAFVHFPGMSQPIYNTYTVNQKNKNKQQKKGCNTKLI